jgi:trigger factor
MTQEEIDAIREDEEKLKALRDEVRDDAVKSVKATFLVDALAQKEGLSVSDDEVTQVLQYEAIMNGQDPAALLKYYEQNNLLPAVKMSLLEDKLYTKMLGLEDLQ